MGPKWDLNRTKKGPKWDKNGTKRDLNGTKLRKKDQNGTGMGPE